MSTTSLQQTVTATFNSNEEAEDAVFRLGKVGFDLKDITVLGLDLHSEEHPVGFVNTGSRVVAFGKYGAFWGALWGFLFGSALIFIPGVGTIVLAGWLAASPAGAAEGLVVGGALGALGGALVNEDIPGDSVIKYETALKAGKFLVIARGSPDALALAYSTFGPHAEMRNPASEL